MSIDRQSLPSELSAISTDRDTATDRDTVAELEQLVCAYFDHSITPDEFSRLEELLISDSALRRVFRRWTTVHSELFEAADSYPLGDLSLLPLMQFCGDDDDDCLALSEILESSDQLPTASQMLPQNSGIRRSPWAAISMLCGVICLLVAGWALGPRISGGDGSTTVAQDGNADASLPDKTVPVLEVDNAVSVDVPSTNSPRVIATPSVQNNRTVPPLNLVRTDDVPLSGPPVALLRETIDATWKQNEAFRSGDLLGPGELVLEQGVATLVFLSGASVVLEGPTSLELVSADKGILHSGRLRLSIPPQAKGFEIETKRAQFVDLGTEFAVEVGDDGREELHVFDGEVEVYAIAGQQKPPTIAPQSISTGQGLAVDVNGQWSDITPDASRFTDASRVHHLINEQAATHFERWQAERDRILAHPDLYAFYDFEQDEQWDQTLRNRKSDSMHGAVVGCRWTEGRWPNKTALEFKNPADRVRLDVPGLFESFTLSVWMRVDGFDRDFNSIFLTDKFEAGEFHWQVKSDGRFDMGIKYPNVSRLVYLSEAALDYQDLGRWFHAALVVNGTTREVTHFLNGQPLTTNDSVESARLPEKRPGRFRIGKAELGNWSPAKIYDNWPIRNLNGRMDEFAIFNNALSAEEIEQLYVGGAP